MVFIALMVLVLLEQGPVLFDGAVLEALESWRTPDRTAFVRGLTGLGGSTFMIPASVLVIALVFWRSRRAGAFLGLAIGGSALLNEGMKLLIDRPRPSMVLMVYQPRGLSFPSGHSQASMAFALGLLLVFWSLRMEWRNRVVAFLGLPLVVGWTRTYLGVHYPSDVLAGWCLATVWVMLCYAWFRNDHIGPFRRPPGRLPEIRESVRSSAMEPVGSVAVDGAPPPR